MYFSFPVLLHDHRYNVTSMTIKVATVDTPSYGSVADYISFRGDFVLSSCKTYSTWINSTELL